MYQWFHIAGGNHLHIAARGEGMLMNGTLRDMDSRQKIRVYGAWALLVLSPWIQLIVISIITGKNALFTYPVWTDELDYWRSVFSWIHVGFPAGYNGIAEYPASVGTLSVRGLTPILLYGGWAKLLGLEHFGIVLFNALWVSTAALVFCAMVRPRAGTSLLVAALLICFAPAVLYVSTSMTEMFNYALLLLYAAFLFHTEKTGRWWSALLCWLTVVCACLYRVPYWVLFVPLIAVNCRWRFSLKTLWLSLVALSLAGATFVAVVSYSALSPGDYLYQWFRQTDPSLFFHMLLSHVKFNLNQYLAGKAGNIMEVALRWLYCLAAGWALLASFVSIEKVRQKTWLKLHFSKEYMGCFLLLFVPFALILMFYTINDWFDFRMLSPFLWGVAAILAARGKRRLPSAVLAGSVAMLGLLIILSPVGVFREEQRFSPPLYREEIREACEAIVYRPDASDPFANTVRTDLFTYQVIRETDPAMGFMTGWFTTQNTGKSGWILTDHLKIIVEGYENRYDEVGAKVYCFAYSYEK